MNTRKENVVCVYDEQKKLVAIIKRDDVSGKKVISTVEEAGIDDIVELINPNQPIVCG